MSDNDASLPVSPSNVSLFHDTPASGQFKPTVNTEPRSSPGGTLNRHASATPNFSRKTVARNVDIRLRARDIFHGLVSLSWPALLGVSVSIFLLVNIICAAFLRIQDGSVAGAETYGEYLAFCIQSSATIGFGYFHPATQYAYACITVLSFISLLVTAMFTGLVFARFSRPSGLIRFSDVCLVSTFNGKKAFQFRLANGRSQNRMIDASITAMMARDEVTTEGLTMRRFYEIPLVRDKSPNFSVMWLVVSDLENETNVLKDISEENFNLYFRNIVVNLSGYDLETCQTVYESHVYFPSHVRFSHQFSDMVSMDASQTIIVDHAKINMIVPHTAPGRPDGKSYSPKLAPAPNQDQFVPDITTPLPSNAGFNFTAKQPSITGMKHISEMN